MEQERAVERLLRQMEARVAAREDLRSALLGLAATGAIVVGVLTLLALVLAGAILFSVVLHALSG